MKDYQEKFNKVTLISKQDYEDINICLLHFEESESNNNQDSNFYLETEFLTKEHLIQTVESYYRAKAFKESWQGKVLGMKPSFIQIINRAGFKAKMKEVRKQVRDREALIFQLLPHSNERDIDFHFERLSLILEMSKYIIKDNFLCVFVAEELRRCLWGLRKRAKEMGIVVYMCVLGYENIGGDFPDGLEYLYWGGITSFNEDLTWHSLYGKNQRGEFYSKKWTLLSELIFDDEMAKRIKGGRFYI